MQDTFATPGICIELARVLPVLCAQLPSDTAQRVRDTLVRHRALIRDALRQVTRLALRSDEESGAGRRSTASVAIDVQPGFPDAVRSIEVPQDFELLCRLAMHRTSLKRIHAAAPGLQSLLTTLGSLHTITPLAPPSADTLARLADWSGALLEALETQQPVKILLNVRADILGAYTYRVDSTQDDRGTNPASICLYWGAIGVIGSMIGCAIEDLTVVTLTHELAHAYTQLGADIDGRRWLASAYAHADVDLKEGLAQYFTDRVLYRPTNQYVSIFGYAAAA